jgi:hypothetical protein
MVNPQLHGVRSRSHQQHGDQVALHQSMLNFHKTITKILPVAAIFLWSASLQAQTPKPGTSDKPKNPPPYANQPATGIGPPPEGTTPHDTPAVDQSKNESAKAKAAKKPARKAKKKSN